MERSSIHTKKTYITKSIEFSSAHYYYIDEWSEQENFKKFGLCADKCSHGHNYLLHVRLKGTPDTKTGMIINLIDLKQILKENVISKFDHKNLNVDTEYFKKELPTTENLCKVIWNLLRSKLPHRLDKITVIEDEDLWSFYKGEGQMFYITRVYKFSASHRLYNVNLTDDENEKIFGKCNNYNAHGHNFRLEVTLSGFIDAKTGMIYDIIDMDNIVSSQIIEKLDHKNLSENVEDLKGMITTGENLTKFIWDKLDGKFKPAKLFKIKLFETERNYFEYYGG